MHLFLLEFVYKREYKSSTLSWGGLNEEKKWNEEGAAKLFEIKIQLRAQKIVLKLDPFLSYRPLLD